MNYKEIGFYLETIRFDLKEDRLIHVTGSYPKDDNSNQILHFRLDNQELEYTENKIEGLDVQRKYVGDILGRSVDFTYDVILPEKVVFSNFRIIDTIGNKDFVVKKLSQNQLNELKESVPNFLEAIQWDGDSCTIRGWAAINDSNEIYIAENGNKIPAECSFVERKDVRRVIPEADSIKGYSISFVGKKHKSYQIMLKKKDGTWQKVLVKENHQTRNKTIHYVKRSFYYAGKTVVTLFTKGPKATAALYKKKITNRTDGALTYKEFREKHLLSKADLEKQRNHEFQYQPVFSIAIPLYKTPERYLREMIDSVRNQTYKNWELCLVDGSGSPSPIKKILDDYANKDSRIKVKYLEENLGIAGNTNATLDFATGDFIVLADHDDIVAPDALFECAKALNEHPEVDVIYTDEDKVDMEGKEYFDPNFKPDFNIDYLCSVNYICHLFVFSKKLYEKVGGFRSEFEGAQDHDLILRYTEQANGIYHIPKVLYHWRCHINSTAESPESKLYAFENGAKAVEEHYKRIGIPAHVEQGLYYGLYHTVYDWVEEPKVSILVPTKDHIDDLEKCFNSINDNSSYRNMEWIIIENNSTEPETWEYYKELEKHDNVKVVTYTGDFNYSKINNFGAKYATGEYLLLLNNDTEMIGTESLKEMVHVAMRPDVGIVGACLYYPDDTVQHAGVVIGFGGIAGHTFIGQPKGTPGYVSRMIATQDYSAVTAACMMIRKSIFDEVGGLTESFAVAFNDIDLCMKVRAKNYLVVYNPQAEFYHYESKSRGMEDTPEKVERFNSEVARFRSRWSDILEKGDPYYNPNLALDRSDFALKREQ